MRNRNVQWEIIGELPLWEDPNVGFEGDVEIYLGTTPSTTAPTGRVVATARIKT